MNVSKENSQTLYPISIEGRRGFIDASGTIVIPPQFLSTGEFSEGLARVTVPGLTEEDRLFERNASGFISERGDFVIGPGSPPGYEFPEERNDYLYGDFHEGLATFWIGDSTGFGGYIDRTGRIAIPPKYVSIDDFSQGLACVSLPRTIWSALGLGSAGFINPKGKFVVRLHQDFIATGFSEGLCAISYQDEEADWHASVINLKGETVIPPHIYTGISDFVGGLARVVKDGKVGCIDATGKIAIPIEFDQLWEFEHNPFTTAKKAGKHLIVDRKGRCVREIAVDGVSLLGRLRSGLATVKSNNKVGYVNEDGSLAIPMHFDRGEDFRGELALVESDGFTGYISRHGDFVWKTDCWDEPVRNAVVKPLSEFLPPPTIESLPLEYNWQGFRNAIVFASNQPFESVKSWFTKEFGSRYELLDGSSEPSRLDIHFFGEGLHGSIHVVDVNGESVEGFLGFYVSRNMKLLMEKHRPAVLGILILGR